MKWINVRDQLPNPMVRVLVVIDIPYNNLPPKVIIARMSNLDAVWVAESIGSISPEQISHWQPLPAPNAGWAGNVSDAEAHHSSFTAERTREIELSQCRYLPTCI